jgi:hypothetical protein
MRKFNQTEADKLDVLIFRQLSKFIIDTLARLMMSCTKCVSVDNAVYRNTGTSSILPIIEGELKNLATRRIVF